MSCILQLLILQHWQFVPLKKCLVKRNPTKAHNRSMNADIVAHMKQHDDRREQNLIEMNHQQAYIINKLTEELEELRQKNS